MNQISTLAEVTKLLDLAGQATYQAGANGFELFHEIVMETVQEELQLCQTISCTLYDNRSVIEVKVHTDVMSKSGPTMDYTVLLEGDEGQEDLIKTMTDFHKNGDQAQNADPKDFLAVLNQGDTPLIF